MQTLSQIARKRRRLVIGMMSGTSADGIDAVCVEIAGSGTGTKIRQLAHVRRPYPRGYREFVLRNSDARTARLDQVARLNMLAAALFAGAARAAARRAGLRLADIDLIGSHGQTIHHLPRPERLFGHTIRATLQIGDPAAIAKLTGVFTVGNFRAGDVAAGGSGAPLVPYFDFLMLRSATRTRAALNLGGIANVTILPRACTAGRVRAFDTGPGNMVIDALMQRFFRRPFDRGGATAARGSVHTGLLAWMMRHPYLAARPPKSTGRETFGADFVDELVRRGRRIPKADLVATATAFTARSVRDQIRRFARARLDELLVSGGGAANRTLMGELERLFPGVRVTTSREADLAPQAKEAICFAVLANEAASGNPANLPGVTGARRRTVLGVICPP